MLEQIDLDRSLSKKEFAERVPELQSRLYEAEGEVVDAGIPVAIVFEGWAGTSKIGTIGLLTKRLDPRGLRIHPITPPRSYEQQFHWLQRFWLKTPSYGQLAIFDRSWYREVLADRTRKQLSSKDYRQRCEDIVAFERQLADDGAVILKFCLHISKHEQARRFKELLGNRLTAIQVNEGDLWQHRHYKRVLSVTEDLLARTSTHFAPWIVVPATDRQYAQVMVMETVVQTLEARLAHKTVAAFAPVGAGVPEHNGAGHNGAVAVVQENTQATAEPVLQTVTAAPGILSKLDLSQKLDDSSYEQKLAMLQAKLYVLGLQAYQKQRPVALVFEGWDAAGKGGTIKRITAPLDPRAYTVHTIAAPSGDDKLHHYLYRFWRRLPARGQIGIFDRSWYGRVLVERVEGFARPDEWQRAYNEINEFERQLTECGTIICKFWLHLSQEEQLRRFEQRRNSDYKAWKLTDEDWRNREKWPMYEEAADEMLVRTSTPGAPWTVVESEDKKFGRIKAIREIVRRLESELGKVKL